MKENIVEFPDRSSVQSEAALWLIKLDADQHPTEEVLASLREWLSRSPAHREELRHMAATWSSMNVLTELAVPLGKIETSRRFFAPLGALRSRLSGVSRVIAVPVLLVGVVYSFYMFWPQPEPRFPTNGVYATVVGEQKTVMLSDGSAILLNTNSEVVVDYSREYRDIRLARGEVEFTVAKNPASAFRVYAGNERVQALGTAFTVYIQDDKIDVTVTEGLVTLATLSQPVTAAELEPAASDDSPASAVSPQNVSKYVETLSSLRAGQSASVNITSESTQTQLSAVETVEVIQEQDLARRLSWREGLLVFAGDPLEDVVREISRYTTVAIEISDPEVKAIKIGGQFQVGETDAMLESFETNFGLLVTRLDENRVVLSAAKN